MTDARYSLLGEGTERELQFHGDPAGREAILDGAIDVAFQDDVTCVVVVIAMDDSDFVMLAKARQAEFLPVQCGLAEVRFRRKKAAEKE